MHTQIAFKQYNPDKPAKYGLLFKSVYNARFSYTYASAPYGGKPEKGTGPFYVTGTENHVKILVNRFMENAPLQGRRMFCYCRLCSH